MARLRNIKSGVVVEVADGVALSRWEWESADKPASTKATDKPSAKKSAAKATPKPKK